jgi:hypothetical protein
MLNEALQVAFRRQTIAQEKEKVAELLSQLPIPALREIAETGEIKLAFLCGPDGGTKPWVDQFKGTPFFQQAIALEQEDLQAQMACQQEQKLTRQKSESSWDMMDQIRLKKKLLELQKARNEAQALDGVAGPSSMTGSPDAQGAGAPGPMATDVQQGAASDTNKMAMSSDLVQSLSHTAGQSAKAAISGRPALTNLHAPMTGGMKGSITSAARKGTLIKNAPPSMVEPDPFKPKTAASLDWAEKHIVGAAKAVQAQTGKKPYALTLAEEAANASPFVKKMIGNPQRHRTSKPFNREALRAQIKEIRGMQGEKTAAEKLVQADVWGRELARGDAEKIAHSQEVLAIGEAVGQLMAKSASGVAEAGKGLLEWAVSHPHQAGAAVGGTLGAAHGLLKEDGGVGSALAEGAAGAGTGYAVGGIAGGMRGGNSLADSTKMMGAHVRHEAGRLSDKVRAAWKEAPKPEAVLSGPQVQQGA